MVGLIVVPNVQRKSDTWSESLYRTRQNWLRRMGGGGGDSSEGGIVLFMTMMFFGFGTKALKSSATGQKCKLRRMKQCEFTAEGDEHDDIM